MKSSEIVSSLCYHYNISQTYGKVQLIYRGKRETEIHPTKLSDEKCANRFCTTLLDSILYKSSYMKNKIDFVDYIKTSICNNGSSVAILRIQFSEC